MALPHRLNITGTGFDAGEFFYGCNAAIADGPPGSGSRGLAPQEDALSINFNRAAYALATNDEYLDDYCDSNLALINTNISNIAANLSSLTREIAEPEILEQVIGAPTNEIVVPSATAMYVGGGSYADSERDRDLLVQLTDADGAELIVDGNEVKCTDINRDDTNVDIVGQGFWESTDVELLFSETIPAGTYYLTVGVKNDIANLSEDALVNATIRGSHEAAAEVGKRSVYVCDASGSHSNSDFRGSDALIDAVAALSDGYQLFLRNGTYNAPSTISERVSIIGESRIGTIIALPTSQNLTFGSSFYDSRIENVQFVGDETQSLVVSGYRSIFSNVIFDGVRLDLDNLSDQIKFENCRQIGMSVCPILNIEGSYIEFDGFQLSENAALTGTDGAVKLGTTGKVTIGCVFNRCSIIVSNQDNDLPALRLIWCGDDDIGEPELPVYFNDCYFQGGRGGALRYGDATRVSAATFNRCKFNSYPDTTVTPQYGPIMPDTINAARIVRLVFRECEVDTIGSALYRGPFVQLIAAKTTGAEQTSFISVYDCTFKDFACKGLDTDVNPPSTTSNPVVLNVMYLENVTGDGLHFVRDGLQYDIQDSPWLRLQDCSIRNVRIEYPDLTDESGTPIFVDSTSPTGQGTGLIYLLRSRVTELRVTGWLGSGSGTADATRWDRSLLYMNESHVDGFRIFQGDDIGGNPYQWEFTGSFSYLVRVYLHSTLSRFHWNGSTSSEQNNSLTSTAGKSVDALVDVGSSSPGDGSVMRDCHIEHETTGRLLPQIADGGNESSIVSNLVRLTDPGNALVGMNRVFGLSDGVIANNMIKTVTSVPSGTIIYCSSSPAIGNIIDCANGVAYDAIDAFNLNGGPVVGNRIKGTTVDPDINPNTVTGYDTNFRTS